MDFFRRKKDDDDAPLDPNARYRSSASSKGSRPARPADEPGRGPDQAGHALYYLYFASRDIAEQGAEEARAAG